MYLYTEQRLKHNYIYCEIGGGKENMILIGKPDNDTIIKHYKWFLDYIKRYDKHNIKWNKTKTRLVQGKKKISMSNEAYDLINHIIDPVNLNKIIIGSSMDLEVIIERVLLKWPRIFSYEVNKSVRAFLVSKTTVLKNNYGDMEVHEEIKLDLDKYFKRHELVLEKYINDYKIIGTRIDKINFVDEKAMVISIEKLVDFKIFEILNSNDEKEIYDKAYKSYVKKKKDNGEVDPEKQFIGKTSKQIEKIIDKDIKIKEKEHLANKSKSTFDEVDEILSSLFNYKNFTEYRKIKWDAYKLVDALDVSTCPYCNRAYTFTYDSNQGRCRADLDHFYPKSKYPFLSVSLFNLIPSCHICNSSLKGSKDFYFEKHMHPYYESFSDDAFFNITSDKSSDLIDVLYGVNDNFRVFIDKDSSSILDDEIFLRINNSTSTFKIEELYSKHTDYIFEVIKKSIAFSPNDLDNMMIDYGELFLDKDELVRSIFSNYIQEKDLNKRPLSKLTRDIMKQYYNVDGLIIGE